MQQITKPTYFSRDISWLAFNRRVLEEATRSLLPLAERFRFLSIYSSNLDEWYRVRMPALMAKKQFAVNKPNSKLALATSPSEFDDARNIILQQQEEFGSILTTQLIPLLSRCNITLLYNEPLPDTLTDITADYFFTTIAAFLQPVFVTPKTDFFPENNKLYLLISLHEKGVETQVILNIPSESVPRFYSTDKEGRQYIIFIDDIIRGHLSFLFSGKEIKGCYSFKINRDADLNLEDELPETLAEKIENQVAARDTNSASRLLYQSNMPLRLLQLLCGICNISISNAMEGGRYHNLRDMFQLPLHDEQMFYPKQPPLPAVHIKQNDSLFSVIGKKDIIIHSPYNSYSTVLRFFTEAAIDDDVDEIYVSLYRIANDSKIANALISAAKNGKNVQVFVELKARFDEANNIRWAKKMKEAGVKVIYSIPRLKVHAKIALIIKKNNKGKSLFGLLGTGNLNESTARLYTDHVLLTADEDVLHELELLFLLLANKKKPDKNETSQFRHLLVAQINMQDTFIKLIENEISSAKKGLPAHITIKINNLEEQVLISKLYEASNAGVTVHLIVRSICCLIPGIKNMSGNISVKRIVGRYLEHGRVFIFHNNGDEKVLMGSADWMNRNIYTRVEVCFPVYDRRIKQQIIDIINLQWSDNVQAVWLDNNLQNTPVETKEDEAAIDSQLSIYELLKKQTV